MVEFRYLITLRNKKLLFIAFYDDALKILQVIDENHKISVANLEIHQGVKHLQKNLRKEHCQNL